MMKKRMLTIVTCIIEMILIIFVSLMYYLNKPIVSPKVVYIPKGSINKIITHLQKKKYDVSKLDSLVLRFIGSPQNGWIELGTTTTSKADFLYKLTTAKAALQDITLIPGETTYIFLKQIAKQFQLDEQLLQKYYKEKAFVKEGALLPNTYKVPQGIDEEQIIKILLQQSFIKMKYISEKIFGSFDKRKWIHYLSIASVIQKESANIKEMPIVSSVIYNRIKKGMKLQMDGTLNYGKYSHIKITPKRIREDKSSYNTYKHNGIPKYPVCNVSTDAIRAAIFPEKTNYLYFMKNKKGIHDFTRHYSTHLTNIRRATK